MAIAKQVVDAHQATGIVQPGGPPAPVPAPAAVALPGYVFRNRSNATHQIDIGNNKVFTFGPSLTWHTEDPVLGKCIADVAEKFNLEIVSRPKAVEPAKRPHVNHPEVAHGGK